MLRSIAARTKNFPMNASARVQSYVLDGRFVLDSAKYGMLALSPFVLAGDAGSWKIMLDFAEMATTVAISHIGCLSCLPPLYSSQKSSRGLDNAL
jgi:hypothetical protein